jgi:hypothetical protein
LNGTNSWITEWIWSSDQWWCGGKSLHLCESGTWNIQKRLFFSWFGLQSWNWDWWTVLAENESKHEKWFHLQSDWLSEWLWLCPAIKSIEDWHNRQFKNWWHPLGWKPLLCEEMNVLFLLCDWYRAVKTDIPEEMIKQWNLIAAVMTESDIDIENSSPIYHSHIYAMREYCQRWIKCSIFRLPWKVELSSEWWHCSDNWDSLESKLNLMSLWLLIVVRIWLDHRIKRLERCVTATSLWQCWWSDPLSPHWTHFNWSHLHLHLSSAFDILSFVPFFRLPRRIGGSGRWWRRGRAAEEVSNALFSAGCATGKRRGEQAVSAKRTKNVDGESDDCLQIVPFVWKQ